MYIIYEGYEMHAEQEKSEDGGIAVYYLSCTRQHI